MEATTPQSSQIPWRLRKEQFRRYEEILKRAVEAFPLVYRVNPKDWDLPNALVTCSARLRDAKISFLRYNWPSTINRQRYLEIEEELIVAEGTGYLVLGRLDEIRAHFKAKVPQHPLISTDKVQEEAYELGVTRDQFFFLCQLAANNAFSRDLIIFSSDELFNLNEHASLASDTYAISIVPDGEKWRILTS